jgi:hypothetical protein
MGGEDIAAGALALALDPQALSQQRWCFENHKMPGVATLMPLRIIFS